MKSILKFIMCPSRYIKYQNKTVTSLELSIKSNISRFIYFTIQLLLYPNKFPCSSIIKLNKQKKHLATAKINLSTEIMASTLKLASNVSGYFSENINNYKVSNLSAYTMPLNGYLTEEDKRIIENIASDTVIQDHAKSWLNSEAHLSYYMVYANFPNKELINDEGSKLWHRDSDVYAAAEYYINLTKCSDENGPLFIFKDPEANRLFEPHFPERLRGLDPWRRCRWFDSDLKRFSQTNFPACVHDNKGDVGKVCFLDSGIHMHKGGATRRGRRIVLRLIFTYKISKKNSRFFFFRKISRYNLITAATNNILKLKTFG